MKITMAICTGPQERYSILSLTLQAHIKPRSKSPTVTMGARGEDKAEPLLLELPVAAGAEAEAAEVPLICSASSRKFSKLLGPVSTALTENTIPEPQCPVCPQKNQRGTVSSTMIVNVGSSTAFLSTGWLGKWKLSSRRPVRKRSHVQS